MSWVFLDNPQSQLLDQLFRLSLREDSLPPSVNSLLRPGGYLRQWSSSGSSKDAGSTVVISEKEFQAKLDVQQFPVENILVTVSGQVVSVKANHEETEDGHGFVSRSFVRKYVVPQDFDMDKVESKLSCDGVLTVVVPKISERRDTEEETNEKKEEN